MGPEFIIRIKGEPTPRPVEFGELFALRDKLQSLTLLWDCNSYHVNVSEGKRHFLINGGRRLKMPAYKKCTDLKVFYRKRNQQDITFGVTSKKGDYRAFYLLGFEGTVDGEAKLTFLQVSEDGTQWVWRDHK